MELLIIPFRWSYWTLTLRQIAGFCDVKASAGGNVGPQQLLGIQNIQKRIMLPGLASRSSRMTPLSLETCTVEVSPPERDQRHRRANLSGISCFHQVADIFVDDIGSFFEKHYFIHVDMIKSSGFKKIDTEEDSGRCEWSAFCGRMA